MATYSVLADLNNTFGATNIQKWADMDNDGDGMKIAARLLWARELAHERLNAKLRGGRYTVPFNTDSPDLVIANLEAMVAGLILHDARGAEDEEGGSKDPLRKFRKVIEEEITAIRSGRMRLDVIDIATSVPSVIEE